ncbi:MAG: hypothetical protein R3E66_23560 [bacterium]
MRDAGAAQRAHSRLQAILKAVVVGQDVSDPASREAGESTTLFSSAGALEPPYDPAALCLLVEHSNALRQNLDAYAVNIDGFGHRLEPAIDFEAEDADARVADAIFLERSAALERGELEDGAELEPSDEEVAARKRELIHLARVERARLQSFFDFCCFDHSFVDLRRRTRQDLETTGNAYWEVLRDGRGEIARLVYVPSHTVRLMPLDAEPVEVEDRVQVSPVAFEAVPARRRLRRYVQVQGTDRVYFKAFGDPRSISKRTGAVFPSVEALRRADQRDGPATEILHFAIHSPRTPYGVPRWVGALLSVLGSRQMEEVNYLYFENKSVPPLALLISGGRLSESSVPRIERFIEENLKGKTNFHKILILEAEGGQGENRARAPGRGRHPGRLPARLRGSERLVGRRGGDGGPRPRGAGAGARVGGERRGSRAPRPLRGPPLRLPPQAPAGRHRRGAPAARPRLRQGRRRAGAAHRGVPRRDLAGVPAARLRRARALAGPGR